MRWDIIPQAFYDLIARVVPGGVVLFLGYCVFAGPTEGLKKAFPASSEKGPGLLPLFLCLVFSYVVGWVLSGIWEQISHAVRAAGKMTRRGFRGIRRRLIVRVYGWFRSESAARIRAEKVSWKKRWGEYDALALLVGAPATPCSMRGKLPGKAVLHDHLRSYAPSDAFRLLKLRAETRMLRSLVVGLTILLIVALVYWSVNRSWDFHRVLFILGILGTLVSCWCGAGRSQNHYLAATQRAWLFHNHPLGAAASQEAMSSRRQHTGRQKNARGSANNRRVNRTKNYEKK